MIKVVKPMSSTAESMSDEQVRKCATCEAGCLSNSSSSLRELERRTARSSALKGGPRSSDELLDAPASRTLTRDEKEILRQPAGDKPSIFARIKKIKHIEIYAAAAVIAVMVLIFFSSIGGGGAKSSGTSQNLTVSEDAFVQDMESKLVKTLSQVKGAGNVTAMVTAVGSSTLDIAYNIDEKTITQNGGTSVSTTTTTVTKTPLLVGGQPFVLGETKPQLKGIVIVAGGANDVGVRLNLLLAVETLVADNTVKIEILAHK